MAEPLLWRTTHSPEIQIMPGDEPEVAEVVLETGFMQLLGLRAPDRDRGRVMIGREGQWQEFEPSDAYLDSLIVAASPATSPLAIRHLLTTLGLTGHLLGNLQAMVAGASSDTQRMAAMLERIEALLLERSVDDRPSAKTGPADELSASEGNEVKPTLVNMASIASEVGKYPVDGSPVWTQVLETYPRAEPFALDADPRSFDVSQDGKFDGRAALLISVPTKLRSGKPADMSVRIPTIVSGKLSPAGEITITGVEIAA